jgi:hypothetical protein
MRSVELLACQIDEPLADALARWATPHGVWLRRLAAPDALLNLLRGGSRGLIVLRLGRDLTRELETLRAAVDGFPGIRVVVLGEVEHPELEGLVYDLGASAAIFGHDQVDRLLTWLPAFFASPPIKRSEAQG